jgi:hypothetical protein
MLRSIAPAMRLEACGRLILRDASFRTLLRMRRNSLGKIFALPSLKRPRRFPVRKILNVFESPLAN